MPPIAPHIPPNPTTEPTAGFGNMSDASVNTLQDQPWCAAAAMPTSITAIHSCRAYAARGRIGTTASAQTSIAVLRERFTLHPRLMSDDDSHPPPMLPTVAN